MTGADTTDRPLDGRTVAITAERRSEDQARLFTARGATVIHAPTMHTIELTDDDALRSCTDALITSPPEWTVATTGFGMRLWFEAADGWGVGEALLAALGESRVVARGPKARSACRQRGLDVAWSAPDESMPEVLAWLGEQPGLANQTVAVQLFDPEDHPSTDVLRRIAGAVVEVPIYRWREPDDLEPVHALVRAITEHTIDAVTFTSQPAIRFLVEIAERLGRGADVVAAFNDGSVLPVCVGPVCAEAAVAAGITTSVWPDPYRLVPMVTLTTDLLGA